MASNLGQGEHGAGTGLAGGYGTATAANTQAGAYAQQEQQGFNHGLGGEHASGGIPGGHSGSAHPIADKFTGGDKLDNKLDNFTGAAGAGGVGSGVGSGGVSGNPVAGEYAGSGTRDALTGESHATRTGAGVGPLGENTGSGLDSTTGSHGHGHGLGHGDAKLAPPIPTTYTTGSTQSPVGASAGAGAFAAAAGAGAAGAGAAGAGAAGLAHGSHGHGSHGDNANLATASGPVDTSGVDVDSNKYGTGVGASGGAGGHYDETSRSGAGAGALAGAGAAGAAGAGAGAAGASGKEGHFGTAEKDFDRGAPVSDPKSLDTGGPHSLVFQESTGKYVHRHELEGAGSATKH